ncbi:MAG: hypothetical protein KBF99_03110 [Leptospiraceae bacterium]|nr:hypothetical protein [Leptospiraceae bacterium]MBL0266488.1 hypothetical protein [Leptospiraceae bacterium]MBP9162139.1 hypothetical protein [Leptospiraceae bacterium]
MNLTLLKRLILIFLMFFFINCNIQNRFFFIPKPKKIESEKISKSFAIELMQDLRQKDYETDMGYILFPFVLWETDNSHKRIFEPFAFYQTNKVLTYALKKEIQSYQKFKEVYVATESDSKDADFILRGKILKTDIKRTYTLYGLSVFGIYLLPFGLPFSHHQLDTEFEFELVEAKTNKTLLSKKYPAKFSAFENLYSESFVKKANPFLEKQLESFAKDCMDVLNK